jgi:heme-degrading monooxygenase HmoA
MYVIIWEYYVKPDYTAKFEKIYGERGIWVGLFERENSYLGTELLRDANDLRHYMTIDRWVSVLDYELFLSKWRKEYEKLDAECEALIEREFLLGKWESISDETR